MASHLCCLLVVVFIQGNALAILPIPEVHFEDMIVEDDDTKITCTLQNADCMEVNLEIKGNATLKNCKQTTENHCKTVSKICAFEVTKEMDKMEFTCEAHFKTVSKPKKMYLQTDPEFTDCPAKQVWKEGEENSFHCKATGYPLPTVTCAKGNTKYTEGEKFKTWRNMTGLYTCTARNFDSIDKKVEVSVEYKPEALKIKVNPPLHNKGDKVTINCNAEGVPAPVYSWTTPSSDVKFSSDNATITIQSMQESLLGIYGCTASNKHGSVNGKEELSFAVQPKIVNLKVEPSSEVLEGHNVTLSCEATGFPTPTLSWVNPKARAVPHTNGAIKIWNVKKEDIGKYTCTAQNKHGSSNRSQEITLAVKPKVLNIQVKPSATVSENQNLTLTCVAQGVPSPTYSWDPQTPGVILSSDKSTINIVGAQKAHAGDYTCTARNKYGQDTMRKRITVTEKGNRGDRTEMSITTILSVLISTSLMLYFS